MAKIDQKYLSKIFLGAVSGDSNAFATLYAATYQKLYYFAFLFWENDELAKEAVVESYSIIYKRMAVVTNPELFLPWMHQICFRVCVDMKEKQLSQTENSLPYSEHITVDNKEYSFHQILNLPFSESQTLFLQYYKKLSLKQICYVMDLKKKDALRNLIHGKKRLRKISKNTERNQDFEN